MNGKGNISCFHVSILEKQGQTVLVRSHTLEAISIQITRLLGYVLALTIVQGHDGRIVQVHPNTFRTQHIQLNIFPFYWKQNMVYKEVSPGNGDEDLVRSTN